MQLTLIISTNGNNNKLNSPKSFVIQIDNYNNCSNYNNYYYFRPSSKPLKEKTENIAKTLTSQIANLHFGQ